MGVVYSNSHYAMGQPIFSVKSELNLNYVGPQGLGRPRIGVRDLKAESAETGARSAAATNQMIFAFSEALR